MKVAQEIIAALCRKHAPDLFTPVNWQGTPLDKVRLLWGIAGVESTFGFDCNPKHEAGYCYGGHYFDRDRSHSWGCLAHCSYGPWQAMFDDFPLGVSPLSLMWDTDGRVASETSLVGALRVLNHAISHGAAGLPDIVLHYNGPQDVQEYSSRLVECMGNPMPESVFPVTV
jgi:hypothetical protein